MNSLIEKLTQAGLISNGQVVLNQCQTVELETFHEFFGSTDGSYATLTAADVNIDGTTKGYTRFFDAWKEAGIL